MNTENTFVIDLWCALLSLDRIADEVTPETQPLDESSGSEKTTPVRKGRPTFVLQRARDTPLLRESEGDDGE